MYLSDFDPEFDSFNIMPFSPMNIGPAPMMPDLDLLPSVPMNPCPMPDFDLLPSVPTNPYPMPDPDVINSINEILAQHPPVPNFSGNHYMFSNPWDDGLSIDDKFEMGMIDKQSYDFIKTMFPERHHEPITFEREPERPIIGPSKDDWNRFDEYDADQKRAVDDYHSYIADGDLDAAERAADRARDLQYKKDGIYNPGYVTDVDKRAGLI